MNALLTAGAFVGAAALLSLAVRARRGVARTAARDAARDAEAAREIARAQQAFQPEAAPEIPGWEWAQHYAPGLRASGDLHAVVTRADGRIALLLGGTNARGADALTTLRRLHANAAASLADARSADDCLARLGAGLPDGPEASACVALLDPASGAVEFALAAHEPPVRIDGASGATESLAASAGPPLGPAAAGCTPHALTLAPGDALAFFSPGLTAAEGPRGERFGAAHLASILRGSHRVPLERVRDRVLATLASHTAGEPIRDDSTLLLLRRQVPRPAPLPPPRCPPPSR